MRATILLSSPAILRVLLASLEHLEVTSAGAAFAQAFDRVSRVAAPNTPIDRAAVALVQIRARAAAFPC